MTKIICGVTNCYLNKDKCCCASNVNVLGQNAVNRGSTCCSTFGEKVDGFSNSAQTPQDQSYIACNATNCIHNENNKCTSQTIQIHGNSSANSKETFCTTFHCK
ncbi:DUF1540 domain-containing protein [Sedimentibacter sp. zth1]|uniref:DUF1540 domain-containing protein n=1 Tax=Sedimentibacter sp. zth1 TaxID=2816908 RepID=UPI001A92099B|nr:DUF1540 domain-containing protein [Sedimentibacter sp. zth1]QSX06177.1 DUF1540 domain-containing protein [Sedimentibacter sp. zth1]